MDAERRFAEERAMQLARKPDRGHIVKRTLVSMDGVERRSNVHPIIVYLRAGSSARMEFERYADEHGVGVNRDASGRPEPIDAQEFDRVVEFLETTKSIKRWDAPTQRNVIEEIPWVELFFPQRATVAYEVGANVYVLADITEQSFVEDWHPVHSGRGHRFHRGGPARDGQTGVVVGVNVPLPKDVSPRIAKQFRADKSAAIDRFVDSVIAESVLPSGERL